MEEPKKEATKLTPTAVPAKKIDATTGTTTKKKRSSTGPAQEGKPTKKKKKDAAGKKKKKAAAAAAAAVAAAAAPTEVAAPAAAVAVAPIAIPTSVPASIGSSVNLSNKPLLDQVLFRLTEGIPRMELKSMVREADDCERALIQEIQVLEEALKREQAGASGATDSAAAAPKAEATTDTTKAGDKANDSSTKSSGEGPKALEAKIQQDLDKQVNIITENPYNPLDRCFTLSALLGRLRDDLALPSTRKPSPAALAASSNTSKKKKANSNPAPTYPQLVALADNPAYTRVHPDPPTQLLHVWRKIASHRTAMVFRRPVKPEEAPGYAERILFPMDLSLVRKMIVARILTSYSEVHQRIRLISHNCVKYNGRESDYGVVAREFEAVVDEYMAAAVQQTSQQASTGAAVKAATPKAAAKAAPKNAGGGSGRNSPKNVGGGSGRSSPKTVGGSSPKTVPSGAAVAAAAAAAATAVATSQATKPAAATKP